MIPTITAFERSPDRGRGLARDMRVRWALEVVGRPYYVRLLSFSEMKEADRSDGIHCSSPARAQRTVSLRAHNPLSRSFCVRISR